LFLEIWNAYECSLDSTLRKPICGVRQHNVSAVKYKTVRWVRNVGRKTCVVWCGYVLGLWSGKCMLVIVINEDERGCCVDLKGIYV
jgi:hypothetical protein